MEPMSASAEGVADAVLSMVHELLYPRKAIVHLLRSWKASATHPAPPRETRSEGEARCECGNITGLAGCLRHECILRAKEETARQACIDLYWEACTSQSVAEQRVDAYRAAILAAARERVEALRQPELPNTVAIRDDEGDCVGFTCPVCSEREDDCRCEAKRDAHNAALDAALAALTPTPEAT